MDIFKLIFEHDITLEHLSGNDDPGNREKDRNTLLASFLKPQQTYNRYYFTGSRIREKRFGLSTLEAYPDIIKGLDSIFTRWTDNNTTTPGESTESDLSEDAITPHLNTAKNATSRNMMSEYPEHSPVAGWHQPNNSRYDNLAHAVNKIKPFEVLISGVTSDETVRNELVLDQSTGIRECFMPLSRLLDRDHLVVITEKAHQGIDLHLFSRHNIYEQLFSTFQQMVGPRFRYFSINGKRVGSERKFYFETWTLERPPHGFQEVTPNARIR